MEKIYSKKEPSKLLHIIVRKSDFCSGRSDIVPEDQFIQCSILSLKNEKTFKPHKHIWKRGPEDIIAQESWVIIQGRVKCSLYDIDNILLAEPVLYAGDASFTLQGGHTYTILEDDTLVYEYKTGPYKGQQLDKEFI